MSKKSSAGSRRPGVRATTAAGGHPAAGGERARPYHHGSVRKMLMRELLVQVRERGVEAVSLREAARRIGITHAAAYHHFADKTALIGAGAIAAMWQLATELRRAEARPAETAVERVCRIGEAYLAFALREPALFRLAFAPEVAHKDRFPELRMASDAAAAPLVRSLQAWKGGARSIDGEVRELAVALWSLVHGLSVLALDAQLDEGELRVESPNRSAAYNAVVRNAVNRLLSE